MTTAQKLEYSKQARIVKALAHGTRLFLLEQLAKGPRCVQDLTGMVGAEMSTVSRHLSVLKNAGLLADEKRKAQVYYRVRARCVLKVFDCIKAIQQENQ